MILQGDLKKFQLDQGSRRVIEVCRMQQMNECDKCTCMSLHPCCSHIISSPCQILYLQQFLMVGRPKIEGLHINSVPSLLNHSSSSQFVVEGVAASNLAHSPFVDLTKNKNHLNKLYKIILSIILSSFMHHKPEYFNFFLTTRFLSSFPTTCR